MAKWNVIASVCTGRNDIKLEEIELHPHMFVTFTPFYKLKLRHCDENENEAAVVYFLRILRKQLRKVVATLKKAKHYKPSLGKQCAAWGGASRGLVEFKGQRISTDILFFTFPKDTDVRKV